MDRDGAPRRPVAALLQLGSRIDAQGRQLRDLTEAQDADIRRAIEAQTTRIDAHLQSHAS